MEDKARADGKITKQEARRIEHAHPHSVPRLRGTAALHQGIAPAAGKPKHRKQGQRGREREPTLVRMTGLVAAGLAEFRDVGPGGEGFLTPRYDHGADVLVGFERREGSGQFPHQLQDDERESGADSRQQIGKRHFHEGHERRLAERPRYVETVFGVGYRLRAEPGEEE